MQSQVIGLVAPALTCPKTAIDQSDAGSHREIRRRHRLLWFSPVRHKHLPYRPICSPRSRTLLRRSPSWSAAPSPTFKFIKGRVLNAATLVEINASVASQPLSPQHASPRPSALLVKMVIRNNAQRVLTVPKDSGQRVIVRSITEEELARAGQDLTRRAMSWGCPDAYYAEANILLVDPHPPAGDIPLSPGGSMTLTAVFPVPSGAQRSRLLGCWLQLDRLRELAWTTRRLDRRTPPRSRGSSA